MFATQLKYERLFDNDLRLELLLRMAFSQSTLTQVFQDWLENPRRRGKVEKALHRLAQLLFDSLNFKL